MILVNDFSAGPLATLRFAAADLLGMPELRVVLQAAAQRHHEDGRAFSTTALFNAEKNGDDVRISTMIDWLDAWGVEATVCASRGGEVQTFPLRSLSNTPSCTWAAAAVVMAAMGYKIELQLERIAASATAA